MVDSPFRVRRLTAEQIRSVLRRVGTAPPPPDAATVTHDELQMALESVGVPRETIARALDEPEAGVAAEDEQSWLGGPHRLIFERELAGELPEEAREDVVEMIQEELHDTGRVEALGRSLTWTPTVTMQNPPRKVSVKVRVRDGRTRLRIEEDFTQLRLAVWLGFGIGAGFGLGVLGVVLAVVARAPWLGAACTSTFVGLSLYLAHTVTAWVSGRRKRELTRLFQRLIAEVERSARPGRARVVAGEAVSDAQARADAEAAGEAAEDEAQASERR